jgi:hypothetical protein
MKTIALITVLALPVATAAQNNPSASSYISAEAAARSLLDEYLELNNAYLNTSPEARNFCGTFDHYNSKVRRQEFFLEYLYRTPFILTQANKLADTLRQLDDSLETYTLSEGRTLAPILKAIGNTQYYDDLNARDYRACIASRLIPEAGISTTAVTSLLRKQAAAMNTFAQARRLAVKNALKLQLAANRAATQEAAARAAEALGGLTPKEAIADIMATRQKPLLFTEQPPSPESIEEIKRQLAARRLKTR